MAAANPSVALMAFSQAMTATLGAVGFTLARCCRPSAMVGAMSFNTVGPTAVVMISASVMWPSRDSLSVVELTPMKLVTVMSLGSWPTSWTV